MNCSAVKYSEVLTSTRLGSQTGKLKAKAHQITLCSISTEAFSGLISVRILLAEMAIKTFTEGITP